MGSSSHLRSGDVERMLALLEEARRDDPGPALPWVLLAGLAALSGPETIAVYQVLDVPGRRFHTSQEQWGDVREYFRNTEPPQPPDPRGENPEFFALSWQDPMCSYSIRSGDVTSVLLLTDFFPTDADIRNRPMIRDLNPELRSLLEIPLPAPPGLSRRILLGRNEGPAFGERDRQIAALLRPHLIEIAIEAQRRRAGPPRLTRRELEVLALTAAGLTHAQIAEQLVVSVSTVRKHMENVRTRLGVHTAAAAAAIALPDPRAVVRHRPDVPARV